MGLISRLFKIKKRNVMSDTGKCRFYEWDEADFVLPSEYVLTENSDLADALNVFYSAGGYDFFNVVEADYYASNWLDFVGSLYKDIDDEKYRSNGKRFVIPLSKKQKQELSGRGVPSVFVTDIQ
ncbi:MAG: hypothetical protein IKK70_02115 [Clostridia bacterium]|nr:hypothetical protein [Clostridia bacterium]